MSDIRCKRCNGAGSIILRSGKRVRCPRCMQVTEEAKRAQRAMNAPRGYDPLEDPVTRALASRRAECATGKRRYESKAAAKRGVMHVKNRVRAYRCDICHGWHVANTERTPGAWR